VVNYLFLWRLTLLMVCIWVIRGGAVEGWSGEDDCIGEEGSV
jgi:hypothetical protein